MKIDTKEESNDKKFICPVCKKNNAEYQFNKQSCDFFRCKNDNLVFIYPKPDKLLLQKIYDDYGKERLPEKNPDKISYKEEYYYYLNKFLEFKKTNRLLEIGSAFGSLLYLCKKRGWKTYGVEISKPSSEFSRNILKLNVYTGIVQDANYRSNYFDVVSVLQTIEHVPDPRELITESFRILRSRGLLLITIPNYSSLIVKLIREKYRFIGRDHLFYFSPDNIKKLLKSIGFSKITVKTYGFDAKVLSRDLFNIKKVNNLKITTNNYHPVKISFIKLILIEIHNLISYIIGNIGLGDFIIVEAIK